MKKSATRVTIAVSIMILLVLGYYSYLVNRNRTPAYDNITPVERVLLRDLTKDYPPTPKEVMNFYHDIMNCFYNVDCTDEEVSQLAQKARELYDDELKANNQWEAYLDNLKSEIQSVKDNKRRITSFSVSASTDVDFFSQDGYDFARIRGGYNLKENNENIPFSQTYLLRKDEKNHWRIYGWDLTQNVNINQE